jgi:hypothetical protein
MPKIKITISLDSEVAEKLRLQSIEKYHNSRSMSKLIEDLATGAAEAKQPEACSILGHRSEYSFKAEADFKNAVEEITTQLEKIEVLRELMDRGKPFTYPISGPDMYFALKDACELELNKRADIINPCPGCHSLNGPLPKYPDAGRNFEIYATMKNDLR